MNPLIHPSLNRKQHCLLNSYPSFIDAPPQHRHLTAEDQRVLKQSAYIFTALQSSGVDEIKRQTN